MRWTGTVRLRKLAAFGAALATMAGLTVGSASPAAADTVTCFGYTGTFASPGPVYPTYKYVNWPAGGDNCFGISPERKIWQTSAGNPWSVIPGGGLADGLSDYQEYVSGDLIGKTLQVWVAASGNYWCQTWWSNGGWRGVWITCNNGITFN